MRKWVIPLILLLFLILPLRAHAQDSTTFSSMVIEIWPEYDKPSVLVIYQITLDSATTFPATLSIRIPTAAGEPNAVAERQPDGSLYSINSTRQVAGDWAAISFTTAATNLQLEYYDPTLTKVDNARHYEYTWPGDYAIAQLTLQVQQPAGATDMVISPSLGAGTAGSDNLIYYTQDVGAVSAGQTIQIIIDYQKTTDAVSVKNLPIQPSAPVPQSSASDLDISAWLPWVLGILGAGLIIGGIVWFWRTGRQRPARQPRGRRSKVDAIEPETDPGTEAAAVYCSQCGKRASSGDQFCRYCGTQIRAR
jgi:hypothetical protein